MAWGLGQNFRNGVLPGRVVRILRDGREEKLVWNRFCQIIDFWHWLLLFYISLKHFIYSYRYLSIATFFLHYKNWWKIWVLFAEKCVYLKKKLFGFCKTYLFFSVPYSLYVIFLLHFFNNYALLGHFHSEKLVEYKIFCLVYLLMFNHHSKLFSHILCNFSIINSSSGDFIFVFVFV